MEHLHKYAYKWRDIGASLKFEFDEMENISHSSPIATTQQLLHKLLSQWSQWPTADHSQVPTMERLCKALRSGLVGLGAVANDLYDTRTNLPSQTERWVRVTSLCLLLESVSVNYASIHISVE